MLPKSTETSWPITRATIAGTPPCRQMPALLFHGVGYELSDRQATDGIDAVSCRREEITVEEEIPDIALGPQAMHRTDSAVAPYHITAALGWRLM